MAFTSHYLHCAGFEMHYTQWGAVSAPPVIAWHGLARTGRDMDELAEHLSDRYRVICPDMIGRGLSQWSTQPEKDYCLKSYAGIAASLVNQLKLDRVHWVGTSMGGAIGTVCASGIFQPEMRGRIASLVLNDNAPELAASAIGRIREYAGKPPAYSTMLELEAFFREVYKPYGWLSEGQWRKLTETSARRLPDGRVTPHYDPAMVQQFTSHPNDYSLWNHYDALDLPVLCMRGENSDLVEPRTIAAMQDRGPGARGKLKVVQVPGCGHAPALNVPDQLNVVDAFLRSNDG